MNEPTSSAIATELTERVLTIRLDRPQRRNALTAAMYTAIADALAAASDNPEVLVVLFCGHPAAFSSGNDLHDFLERPPTDEDAPVARFIRQISQFPKPLVAAVTGAAIGIGTTLLLHCDLVLAGDDAYFQMPFVNLGICPEAGSSLLLTQTLGYRQAAELLLLGEGFDAARARELGIVNRVTPATDCESEARKLAGRLAAQPPRAVRIAKQLMRRAQAEAVQTTIRIELGYVIELLNAPEAKEAMSAFLEKRQPDFSRFD